jgi:hypothetical protein
MEWTDNFPIDLVLDQRINAKQAYQPLVEQQLVSELMWFGAA